MVNIAILGHGTVGSGVAEMLFHNKAHIAEKAKTAIHIKYILDLREFPGLPYSDRFTKDFGVILRDPEVRVVAELMGGIRPAFDYVKSLLEAGKSVVTSNKELVAERGAELLATAERHNVNFLFEASVGGGIPVLRPIAQCLAANNLSEVTGILNGTTNYILTRMEREGASLAESLAAAQEAGYAERDPAADIEGTDACRKICILASLAFGRHVYPADVATEGISGIGAEDLRYAAAAGRRVKLVGRAYTAGSGIYAGVYPALLPTGHPLAGVDGVFNAILVKGDYIGDVMFYGRGAGKEPTASAVAADIIDCVKHLEARKYLGWEAAVPGYVRDPAGEATRLYVRADGSAEGALAAFPGAEIVATGGETAFITPPGEYGALRRSLESSGLRVRSVIRALE